MAAASFGSFARKGAADSARVMVEATAAKRTAGTAEESLSNKNRALMAVMRLPYMPGQGHVDETPLPLTLNYQQLSDLHSYLVN